jgi:hypothetical protein
MGSRKELVMFEAIVGLLVVLVLIAIALAYFEMTDLLVELVRGIFWLVGEVLRLTIGLVFAVGAFFAYLVNRRDREKKS